MLNDGVNSCASCARIWTRCSWLSPIRSGGRSSTCCGAGPAGRGAGRAAGMSAPAMSRHLRVLRDSGLVEVAGTDGDARVRVYQLRAEPFIALRAWLDQVEAFWAEQLGAFADHAKKRGSE